MAGRSAAGTPSRREWLTVREILDELGVPRRTWQRWRELGRAPQCVKLPNGELRVRRDHFDAWLAGLEDTVA
jgi:hypothetical protein